MDVLFYRGNYPKKMGGSFWNISLKCIKKHIQIEGSVDDLSGWRKNWNVGVGDLIHA